MPSRAELVLRANVVGFDPTTIANDSKLEQHVLYLEKNATAVAGTLAEGTITSSGVAVDTETITVGDVVYTTVTALSEAKATQTLTSSGVATDGETVTIDGVQYTFRTALTNAASNEVLIGVSAAASLDNLKLAINAGATIGTEYSLGTVAHPTVTATTNTDTTQVVEAKLPGTYANVFKTTESMADFAWGAAVLAGGVDPVENEILIGVSAAASLDNLKTTINGTGQGTTCSSNTGAHPQVTADANTDTTQVVTARDMAVTNASIATTETQTNWAWGAGTLAGGVADQNAVDATSAAQVSGDTNQNV